MTSFSIEHITRPSILKENAPVLILLHGYGSDENDLFSFATELPEELFIISLKAPYPLQPYGNAWYAINFDANNDKWSDNVQAIKSRELIVKFIDEACVHYPVNKDNVSLLGFSQGCILSFSVALSYPEKIKNIIGLSGYINEDIIDLKTPDAYKELDIYTSHGSVDQVIPVDWARKTSPFLEKHHVKHIYNEFPVGHGVAPQNFYELKSWLEKKL